MEKKTAVEDNGKHWLAQQVRASKPFRAGKQNGGGLHYKGKDPRGVSRWRSKGDWNGALQLVRRMFTSYGVIAATAAVVMLLYAMFTLSWPASFHSLLSVALIHAVTFGGTGLWALRMRRHIHALATPAQLSERLDVPWDALQQAALAKGIKPRLSINDEDYYNPADFGEEAFTLLRGASEPTNADVLLRAAVCDTTDAHTQQLLRPAHDKDGQAAETAYRLGSQYSADTAAQTVQVSRE